MRRGRFGHVTVRLARAVTAAAAAVTCAGVAAAPAGAIVVSPYVQRAGVLSVPEITAAGVSVVGVTPPARPLTVLYERFFSGIWLRQVDVNGPLAEAETLPAGAGIGVFPTAAASRDANVNFSVGVAMNSTDPLDRRSGKSIEYASSHTVVGALVTVGTDAFALGYCVASISTTVPDRVLRDCAFAIADRQAALWRARAPVAVLVSNRVIVPRLMVASEVTVAAHLPVRPAAAAVSNGPVRAELDASSGVLVASRSFGSRVLAPRVAMATPDFVRVDQYGTRSGAAYVLSLRRLRLSLAGHPIAGITANGFAFLDSVVRLGRVTTRATAIARISSALVSASCTANPYRPPPRSAVALCALRVASAQALRVAPVLAAVR